MCFGPFDGQDETKRSQSDPVGMDTRSVMRVSDFDELLALLDEKPQSEQARMAYEHLQEARSYFLGSMDTEYHVNLKLSRDATSKIPDSGLRSRAEEMLSRLPSAARETQNKTTVKT